MNGLMPDLLHADLLPWALGCVVAFTIAVYVLLDGFDLGVGILFPLTRAEPDRDRMMDSVAPFWDGNETWLILGGNILFAAFPKAYAGLLPALYMPLVLMLFALIFRGIAFEFRSKSRRSRRLWDSSFFLGSLLAAFSQGLMLGAFVHGFDIIDQADGTLGFTAGQFGWLTPFSLICGFGVVAAYALLGSTWLVMKTEGPLQHLAQKWGRALLLIVLSFLAVISIWTPLNEPPIAERWFSLPNFYYLSPVPLVTAITAGLLWRALGRHSDHMPFVLTAFLFLLGFGGLAISLWPYAIPRLYTLPELASQHESQVFTAIGVAVVLPVICAYTIYAYWVFRGKTAGGYH